MKRLKHWLGLCPKAKAGYNCYGKEGECGWKDKTRGIIRG